MPNLFGGPHIWIVLIIVLLLFGAAKLPALAKSMGQSARVFKGEMKAMKEEDAADKAASTASTVESDPAPAADATVKRDAADSGTPPQTP